MNAGVTCHARMQERPGDGSVYDYYRAVEPGDSDPSGATGNDGVPVVQARAPPTQAIVAL